MRRMVKCTISILVLMLYIIKATAYYNITIINELKDSNNAVIPMRLSYQSGISAYQTIRPTMFGTMFMFISYDSYQTLQGEAIRFRLLLQHGYNDICLSGADAPFDWIEVYIPPAGKFDWDKNIYQGTKQIILYYSDTGSIDYNIVE